MGLIITSDLFTNRGNTTNAYINISKATYSKSYVGEKEFEEVRVEINLYLNHEERISDPKKVCNTILIPERFSFVNSTSPGELFDLKGDSNMFEFIYDQLKSKLKERDLSVVDEK